MPLHSPPPPLVSVIVRTMDRPTLARALDSVAAQTWPAIELVVVEAGGAAVPRPQRCGAFPMRQVCTGNPLGRPQAANAGLAAAQGRWALFLDDDDWIDPVHVERLAQRLLIEPTATAAYSGVRCVLVEDGSERELMRYDFGFDPARLVVENFLPIHSVLFSMESARRTAGFDESLPIFEDWDFWVQLARTGPFLHVPGVTATYRLGSGDSGLFGNTALQEQFASRILQKWQGEFTLAEWAGIWRLARQGLQHGHALAGQQVASEKALAEVRAGYEAEFRRLVGEVGEAWRKAADAHEQAAAAQRDAQAQISEAVARAEMQVAQAEAHRRETAAAAHEAAQRSAEALQRTMAEYEKAYALLRHEQYTVLRPIARNTKRAARAVWRRLPTPVQGLVRKALRRPAPAGLAAAPAAAVPGRGGEDDWRAALAGGTPGAFTVLLFPVIDWHFRIQRPQHLARELAKQGHRVLYFSTTFAPGGGHAGCRLLESPAPNVHLVQLALSGEHPNIYEGVLSPQQAQELADSIAWMQQAAGLGPLVSFVDLPFWQSVTARLPANLVVYDCMDYHAGFSTNTGNMLTEEEGLLRDCDLLVTTSTRLAQLMQAKAPAKPHALIRNGTQVDHFAAPPAKLRVERDERPVIGYFGAISEWFDIGLVTQLASQRPQWRFILVGSTFGCDVSAAQALPNVEFTGEVPYSELPGWAHAFDVCLIPFLINELTSCTNPVKVYEYMSAGKPVVATRMPELEAIADRVYLADDAPGFAAKIEQALADNRVEGVEQARRDWAAGHSWESRASELSAAVASCLPRVSVIVLCYNNLELTKACLESVERHSLWPNLEVIAVDNASKDDTPAWLTEHARTRTWLKVILNRENVGFSAGNNVGLAAATGDILILLNNDTEVSPGWIHGLRRHFQRDPRLGMVGPVTDNIGNEAKIDVGYTDKAGMPAWAAARMVHHAGERMASRVLAFFCVAIRREVYQQVGGLDEAFGLGFFEDDDYCNRARAAGWDLAIAEDVFVHHHLSASFDKLKGSAKQALFEKNKAIYESKWGPWEPHEYREAKPAR